MNNDQFLEQVLLDDKFRPMPGHVICMKQTSNHVLEVEGLGAVTASEIRPSGLVVVSTDTKASELVKAMLVTVVKTGDDPYKWETRIPKSKKKEDRNTNWGQQKIQEGTILAVRPIAGVNQSSDSQFLDVRYDEIAAIGQPEDEDCPDMLPAPGWVMVKLREVEKRDHAGLKIQEGLEEILQQGFMLYGEIVGLPRGYEGLDLQEGDVVCFPAHTGVGAVEFVEFDGGLRALPMHDIFGVVEDEVPTLIYMDLAGDDPEDEPEPYSDWGDEDIDSDPWYEDDDEDEDDTDWTDGSGN